MAETLLCMSSPVLEKDYRMFYPWFTNCSTRRDLLQVIVHWCSSLYLLRNWWKMFVQLFKNLVRGLRSTVWFSTSTITWSVYKRLILIRSRSLSINLNSNNIYSNHSLFDRVMFLVLDDGETLLGKECVCKQKIWWSLYDLIVSYQYFSQTGLANFCFH